MQIIDCQQGTPEWWLAKRGIPSASNFSKILTPKTRKLSAQAGDLIAELIADRLAIAPPEGIEGFASRAMLNGIDTEPEARAWYAMERGVDVMQVGFCVTDDGRWGCSPDGLVDEDGGLELKCPLPKTHVGYLLDGGLPADYLAQVHGSLIVTGRAWWDFVSYCPGLPPLMVRVEPDDYTDDLRKAMEAFWPLYEQAWATIQAMDVPRLEPAVAAHDPAADLMW